MTPHVQTKIARKVSDIYETLKLYCYCEPFKNHPYEIHLQNGTLNANGRFSERKQFTRNRLPISYNQNAPEPTKFMQFLHELLEPADILTLQEYLGYCLIPSTKAQAMLFLIGNGGEGKSRIGVVMRNILGDNMIFSNFHRIEKDKFFIANLQNKLLMIDDDMQLQALPSTGYIKTLITSETPIDIEKKSKQSYQAQLYAKFLCFGNGYPKALYDKSDGFSRRLIILTTKSCPYGRVNNPFLAEELLQEREEIFNFIFAGLGRLIKNKFQFTMSEKTLKTMNDISNSSCNISEFMNDDSWVRYGENLRITSVDLYSCYQSYCHRNALNFLKRDSFVSYLRQNQSKFNIRYDGNITDRDGRRCRGFKGISVKL